MAERFKSVSRVGAYDHMNATDPVFGKLIDIDQVALVAVQQNYGVHRLLSALVRALEQSEVEHYNSRELASGLRDLLDRGLY